MALHCPATLLVAPAPRDAKGVTPLLGCVAGERVLAVVVAPGGTVGREVADALGAPLEEAPGLAASGFPSREQLVEIADLHRGEHVLVLTAGPAQEPTDGAYASAGLPVRVEVGSDGVVVLDRSDDQTGG